MVCIRKLIKQSSVDDGMCFAQYAQIGSECVRVARDINNIVETLDKEDCIWIKACPGWITSTVEKQ